MFPPSNDNPSNNSPVKDDKSALDEFFKDKDEGEDKDGLEDLEEGEEKDKEEEDEDSNRESDEEDNEEDKEEEEEEEVEEDKEISEDNVYQQLKSVDKEIFKKVPGLKQVIFRERAFTEICPTPKDAEEAVQAATVFNQYQADILDGDSEPLLKSLEKVGDDSLKKFVANFIPTLEKVDRNLYVQAVLPEIKKILRVAKKNSDERISKAASNLHYYIFNDGDMDKDVGLQPAKEDPSEKKYKQREAQLQETLLKSFSNDAVTQCKSKIRSTVGRIFEGVNISNLQKKHLVDEIIERVDNELDGDKRHMGNMGSLWKQAKNANYTTEWKDRIVNAYLSRAKMSVSKHRKEVLAEARITAGKKEDKGEKVKRITPSGKEPVRNLSSVKGKDVDWSKTSERDLLDGKVTLRK